MLFRGTRRTTVGAISIAFLLWICWRALDAFAQPAWQAEWQRVLSAAGNEGKVVVGVPPSPEIRRGLEKGFGDRYKGIELELRPATPTANIARIINEYKAGIRNFDVFVGGPGQLRIAEEGASEPFEPYMLVPEVKDSKNWFGGHIWVDNVTSKRFVYAFHAYLTDPGYYNADLLRPEEILSYNDLLNPKWKGKIGIYDPRIPGAGQAIWTYLWRVKGERYLMKLTEQGLLTSRDHRQLGDFLAKGTLALALGSTHYSLASYIRGGVPLKALPTPKEGIHATSGSGNLTIIKNPPHPNATKVFVNWLLGREGQEIFGKATAQGTRRFDADTKWLLEVGVQAAKDFLTVEQFLERESSFEDKVPLREPAVELAKKLLN